MEKLRRNEIDFLRAISVIAVIIFHLNKEFFPLGYLGVDLFFVISGYLITRNILKDYKDKKFSFKIFYLKRIRRILPALLVVLLVTTIASTFILLVADINKFSESMLASLGFVANFYFWITGGYFSTSDELKPLLHLWSLSVEEQFYLFFPLFLIIIFKTFKSFSIHIFFIVFAIIVSYGINIFFILKGHYDPIFFLFPGRVWQFGIGSLFAFLPNIRIKNLYLDSLYLIAAFGLILINFNSTVHGLPAGTLLSIGSVMILYKLQNEKNQIFKFVNFKILIFTGFISYSLYLWHWPIITFLKYISIDKLSYSFIFLALFLTFLFATLSWKYVEQPFIKSLKTRNVLISVSSGYLILIFLCLTILNQKDFPSRYDKFPNNLAKAVGSTYHCSISDYRKYGYSYACIMNENVKKKPATILFGNSHAQMYGWGLREVLIDKNEQALVIPLNTCLPFIEINSSSSCLIKAKTYLNAILNDENIKIVIIGFTWYVDQLIDEEGNKINDLDFSARIKAINNLISSLKQKGKKVYLLGPVETPNKQLASILSRQIAMKKINDYEISSPRINFDKKYNFPIEYFSNKLKDNFLLPHEILCDIKNCYFADSRGSYFSDTNHLSFYGSSKMKALFNIY